MNSIKELFMAYKNKQITIRIPEALETQIVNTAWDKKVSRNKIIENILLKTFDLPEELPPIMSNAIWNKLNIIETKLDKLHTNKL